MGSNKMNFTRKAIALTSAISIMLSSVTDVAMAAQVGENVTGAGVNRTFDAATNTTTWQQTQGRAIQDMTSANIAAGETLNINMPSANSFQLNRVNSATHTTWEGALNVNQGHVWFKNPNGLVTGAGFRGDVSNLGFSTHDNAVFEGDNIKFSGNSGGKIIINSGGQLNVSPGGYAVFIAPNDVTNAGTVNAKLGRVELASVDGATVDMNGNGNINFLVSATDLDSAIVTNTGTINSAQQQS
jgi:filamentous hemagglutinin family protein